MIFSTMFNQFIGSLMKAYRNSRFHNREIGLMLAKALAMVINLRKQSWVVKEINGINFCLDLNQVIDSSLYYSGTFEEPEEKIIESVLKPGMTALDIGANFGYHTFRMAHLVSPGGTIYAFEPTSWAFEKLIMNAEINASLNNIQFFKIGLGDTNIDNTNISFQSSYRLDAQRSDSIERISIAKLDSVVETHEIRQIDFVKMDVDGYEFKVISGALQSLKRFQPSVLLEISPEAMITNGDDPEDLIAMLISIGYRFESNRRMPIADLNAYCRKLSGNSSTMVYAFCRN